MRILYLIDSLNVGGAEILLVALARHCLEQGHRVRVAYFTDGPLREELVALGVPVDRLGKRGLADPRALVRLLRLLKRERPDVVHTHLRKSDLAGQLAAGLRGVPVRVSSAHNADPWRRRRLLTWIHRLCTWRCQRVIAVSAPVAEHLVATASYPAERIVTIENGIDLERFDPERTVAQDRTEWGAASDDVTIGVVGRLEPQKGHSVLLEAAVEVVREAPNARFVIVGEGALRDELEAQRARLGLDERVVFAGLSRDVPATLAALDVVVSSSHWEGLPLSLLEAMAMRKPVVATAVGGVTQVMEDGVTGVLVSAADPGELAGGLLRVVRDPAWAAGLGERAAQVVRLRYGEETMHRRILEVYRSLGA